jgi:type VI secretion system protein ImpJ
MSTSAVYWHQGMFLRPHHFQAAERYYADQLRRSSRLDVNFNWGCRSLDIDRSALQNFKFDVNRVEARLPDGTLVLAEKGTEFALPPLELRQVLDSIGPNQFITIMLAVPSLRLGASNTGRKGDAAARYISEPAREPVEDENDGKTPSHVDMKYLNVSLVAATQQTNLAGFETVPIARVLRSTKATGEPILDVSYFPPVLACDAYDGLMEEIVMAIYNRIAGLVNSIGRQVREQNIKFDSNAPEHRKLYERLRALNEAYATLTVLALGVGIHPLTMYTELCRICGRLAIFSKDVILPDSEESRLIPYNHEDLGNCFYRVKRYLDDLLHQDFNQGYEMQQFVGEGLRMKVRIKPDWLAESCQVLVGVESDLPPVECAKLLTGKLNMKLGALERVDELFKMGGRGLEFLAEYQPPAVLPANGRLVYFKVRRDASKEEWIHVRNSFNLAIRINHLALVGSMEGKSEFTIQDGGRNSTFRFTLFVVLPPMNIKS